MTLKQFAKEAGVTIAHCGDGWGGKLSYTTKDSPNIKVCGFRTQNAAYKEWARSTFGNSAAKALFKLLAAPTAQERK